jgi:hypothetical protein
MLLVEQHAVARPAVGDAGGGLDGQHLELADAGGSAPSFAATSSSCERWSQAKRHQRGECRGRRVVAQWMWLIASSLRSARCGLPFFRKW